MTDGERLRAALVNLVANARDSVAARPPLAADAADRDGAGDV